MLNLKLKAPFQGQARAGPARKLAGLGSQAPAPRAPHTKSRLITCMAKPWRPSIDDVDSISWGGPAKVRGTGSRKIPHRLNAEERGLYDLAKKKNYLAVRGTAYRRFRHGNPLPNIWRQWCDAKGQLCVVVEQDKAGDSGQDGLVVDMAPLRLEDTSRVEAALLELAQQLGVRQLSYAERPPDALPFNILPPGQEESEEVDFGEGGDGEQEEEVVVLHAPGSSSSSSGSSDVLSEQQGTGQGPSSGGDGGQGGEVEVEGRRQQVEELGRAVAAQAAEVRRMKEAEGLGNSDPRVQEGVKELLRLKAELAAATARPTTTTSTPVATPSSAAHSDSAPAADAAAPASPAIPPRSPVEHYYSLPIWQINAVPLFFACDRSTAKQFAAEAAQVAKQAIKGAKEEGKAKAKAKAKAPKQPAVA